MSFKKIIFTCFIVLVSKNLSSQIISVEGVWHADTVQYADSFNLSFWLVNTGNSSLVSDSISANIVVVPIGSNTLNSLPISITSNIPLGVLAPGDSINMLNDPLPGGSQLYQQTGDNIVIIWPSSIQMIIPDTSITSLYVVDSSTSIYHDNTSFEIQGLSYIYDLLGRRYENIQSIPRGTVYIRNGNKYIKK